MVYRPHSTRFYVDFASFTWALEFADSGGMLVWNKQNDSKRIIFISDF